MVKTWSFGVSVLREGLAEPACESALLSDVSALCFHKMLLRRLAIDVSVCVIVHRPHHKTVSSFHNFIPSNREPAPPTVGAHKHLPNEWMDRRIETLSR